jgi:hypothetical protein
MPLACHPRWRHGARPHLLRAGRRHRRRGCCWRRSRRQGGGPGPGLPLRVQVLRWPCSHHPLPLQARHRRCCCCSLGSSSAGACRGLRHPGWTAAWQRPSPWPSGCCCSGGRAAAWRATRSRPRPATQSGTAATRPRKRTCRPPCQQRLRLRPTWRQRGSPAVRSCCCRHLRPPRPAHHQAPGAGWAGPWPQLQWLRLPTCEQASQPRLQWGQPPRRLLRHQGRALALPLPAGLRQRTAAASCALQRLHGQAGQRGAGCSSLHFPCSRHP